MFGPKAIVSRGQVDIVVIDSVVSEMLLSDAFGLNGRDGFGLHEILQHQRTMLVEGLFASRAKSFAIQWIVFTVYDVGQQSIQSPAANVGYTGRQV